MLTGLRRLAYLVQICDSVNMRMYSCIKKCVYLKNFSFYTYRNI